MLCRRQKPQLACTNHDLQEGGSQHWLAPIAINAFYVRQHELEHLEQYPRQSAAFINSASGGQSLSRGSSYVLANVGWRFCVLMNLTRGLANGLRWGS